MEMLIINKNKWTYGKNDPLSQKMCDGNNFCVFGFYALNHGYHKEDLQKAGVPEELPSFAKNMPNLFVQHKDMFVTKKTVYDAMQINDAALGVPFKTFSGELVVNSEEERQIELSKMMLQLDIKVIFES